MKVLIAYAGKYCATRRGAEKLSKLLPGATVVDLKKNSEPDITDYDAVIVGGAIRYGLLDRKVKNFLLHNVEALRRKVTAYYVCCGFIANSEQYFKTNFPALALEHACTRECFGGEFVPEKMSKFDRIILKAVTSNTDVKKNHQLPTLDDKAIKRLADAVKAKLNEVKE